jgi:hypothetical protein
LPVNASWLDQIEIVFSELQRKALPPGQMPEQAVDEPLALDDDGEAGARPPVDHSALLEQPGVDRVQQEPGPDRHLDDLGLGGRHDFGAAQVGGQGRPPLGERLADRARRIKGLIERSRPQRLDG